MAEDAANLITTTDRESVLNKVLTGLDVLQASSYATLRGQRVGLLVHPAAVDRHLNHAVKVLHETDQVDLRVLLGPQHGISGQTQDNMIEWEGFVDPETGLPVHSLYGKHRRPTPAMLADIDVLVIDLQDVGSRYYTFIWTMLLAMEACAEGGLRLVVLDRPNPLGGVLREGPVLDPDYKSFVGLAPLPVRHGLTMGELARLFVKTRHLEVELEVVPMSGWRREMDFSRTGLPWVMPSPNMPTLETALVYPGGCLLEGTNLSEGRGTTRPFELLGAPFIDPSALVAAVQQDHLPGCILRPLFFQPTFHKFHDQICGGVQVHVTDADIFAPVATYVALLMAINRLWPGDFAWGHPPYEYELDKLPIDILAGGPELRQAVAAGGSVWDLVDTWQAPLSEFTNLAAEYQLYD